MDLLGVSTCGLLLVDHRGTLNLLAASTERTRLLELFELQNSEGPCLDAYRGGVAVYGRDLDDDTRWPSFTPAARAAGFTSVTALPMRLRSRSSAR